MKIILDDGSEITVANDDVKKRINGYITRMLKANGSLPSHTQKAWTEADSKAVEDMFNAGHSYKEIGQVLNRSTTAVNAQAWKLGLRKKAKPAKQFNIV